MLIDLANIMWWNSVLRVDIDLGSTVNMFEHLKGQTDLGES